MNAIIERYDADARDYARYWAPVLEATSRRLLNEVASYVTGLPAARMVDVGSGTGTLALAAVERWPQASVIVTDAASGMLDVAKTRARDAGSAGQLRLSFVNGPADHLPLADASVDVVLSSFVFQLVPDRPAALREALRILRPGGRLAYVTWLDRESREPFRPIEEFDEAVVELAIEEPDFEDEPHAGDVPSARAAAGELRRAGFTKVNAREEELIHDWTPETYLEYKLAYDERALMSMLNEEQQQQLEDGARRRLATLPATAFRWRAPIVFAGGGRPGA